MLGYLRFMLALMVLLTHLGVFPFGRFVGVSAMVVFMMLSGYSMAHKLRNRGSVGFRGVVRFYRDRILRIYPQYLVIFVFYLLFILLVDCISLRAAPLQLFSNIIVLPVNHYFFIDVQAIDVDKSCFDVPLSVLFPHRLIIPLSWAIALIVQFYIVAPFLLVSKRRMVIASALSMVVFLISFLGYLNNEAFGYRLLPGTLFIFLAGSLLYSLKNKSLTRTKSSALVFLVFAWVVSAVLIACLWAYPRLDVRYSADVLIGFFFGLPLLHYLGRFNVKSRMGSLLGRLSYGVLLSHFMVIWFFEMFFRVWIPSAAGDVPKLVFVLSASMILSYIAIKISQPLEVLRHSLNANK